VELGGTASSAEPPSRPRRRQKIRRAEASRYDQTARAALRCSASTKREQSRSAYTSARRIVRASAREVTHRIAPVDHQVNARIWRAIPCRVTSAHFPDSASKLERLPEAAPYVAKIEPLNLAAVRQEFRASDRGPENSVCKPVRLLGFIQILQMVQITLAATMGARPQAQRTFHISVTAIDGIANPLGQSMSWEPFATFTASTLREILLLGACRRCLGPDIVRGSRRPNKFSSHPVSGSEQSTVSGVFSKAPLKLKDLCWLLR